MRKNYFAKLVNYIKNVYHIERSLNKLTDTRKNPTYNTGRVITTLLLGFLLRIKSLNELDLLIKANEFSNVFKSGTKLPQVDCIRDTLKVVDMNGLRGILKSIVR